MNFFKQPIVLQLSSILGAFGILNLIDSLVIEYLNVSWSLPEYLHQLVELFRIPIRYLFGFITELVKINIPGVWQDYIAMGLIVAGMRLRSTRIILKGIKTGDLKKYKQNVIGYSIIVDKKSSTWKWIAFFSSRLVYAFAIWPAKLFGATYRYVTGNRRKGGKGKKAKDVGEQQYLTFFGSVIWAIVFFILFFMLNLFWQ